MATLIGHLDEHRGCIRHHAKTGQYRLDGGAEQAEVFDVRRTDGRLILLADIIEEGIFLCHGIGDDTDRPAFCGSVNTTINHLAIRRWRSLASKFRTHQSRLIPHVTDLNHNETCLHGL